MNTTIGFKVFIPPEHVNTANFWPSFTKYRHTKKKSGFPLKLTKLDPNFCTHSILSNVLVICLVGEFGRVDFRMMFNLKLIAVCEIRGRTLKKYIVK